MARPSPTPLRQQRDFFRQAKRRNTPYWTLYFLPAASFSSTAVVSKKTAALATERNLIKRRIRSVLQSFQATLPPVQLVVVAKPNIKDLTFQQLKEALAEQLALL